MAANMQNGSGPYRNRWSAAIWGAAAGLLLLPWVAMRFTAEVNWTVFDFIVFGAMLAAACGAYELAARANGAFAYRAAAGMAIAAGFFLVWVNLAVGITGSTSNPANLMFAGVLVVGVFAALVARLRPQGMAKAAVAAAVAQAAAWAIALVFFRSGGMRQAMALTVLTGILVGLWLLSAWLFRKAARAPLA